MPKKRSVLEKYLIGFIFKCKLISRFYSVSIYQYSIHLTFLHGNDIEQLKFIFLNLMELQSLSQLISLIYLWSKPFNPPVIWETSMFWDTMYKGNFIIKGDRAASVSSSMTDRVDRSFCCLGHILQGVPKKVWFTASITSSNSHFLSGHLVWDKR